MPHPMSIVDKSAHRAENCGKTKQSQTHRGFRCDAGNKKRRFKKAPFNAHILLVRGTLEFIPFESSSTNRIRIDPLHFESSTIPDRCRRAAHVRWPSTLKSAQEL
jgi:hypothetical protein